MSQAKQETLLDLAEDFDTAMLVTRAKNGDLRSRPMALAEVKDDGTFFFATDDGSEKIAEIQAEGEVNLVFQSGGKYLSISGRATKLEDKSRIKELWKTSWKVWFPEGKDDPNLCLLRVDGRRGEYWDVSGTNGIAYLWEAGKALVQGERLSVDDASMNAKAELVTA